MKEYRNKIRSRKSIRAAFAQLIDEKRDINKITIKEIVERADISKSTFYAHYSDIYAVFEEFENEIVNSLTKSLDAFIKTDKTEFLPFLTQFIDFLKQNYKLYKTLFHLNKYDDTLVYKMKKIIIDKLMVDDNLSYLNKNKDYKEAVFYYLANGVIYTLGDYYRGKVKLTLDEIVTLCDNMYKNLFVK